MRTILQPRLSASSAHIQGTVSVHHCCCTLSTTTASIQTAFLINLCHSVADEKSAPKVAQELLCCQTTVDKDRNQCLRAAWLIPRSSIIVYHLGRLQQVTCWICWMQLTMLIIAMSCQGRFQAAACLGCVRWAAVDALQHVSGRPVSTGVARIFPSREVFHYCISDLAPTCCANAHPGGCECR